jgi:hypothetical protein
MEKDLEKGNKSLRDALTQVLYQNEMLLGWVNAAVVTVKVWYSRPMVLRYIHSAMLKKKLLDINITRYFTTPWKMAANITGISVLFLPLSKMVLLIM